MRHTSYRPATCAFIFSRLNAFIFNRKKEIYSEKNRILVLFYLDHRSLLLFNNCFITIFFLTPKSHKKSFSGTSIFQPNYKTVFATKM